MILIIEKRIAENKLYPETNRLPSGFISSAGTSQEKIISANS